ncbi:hypothetical protein, partial [Kaistia terrae]
NEMVDEAIASQVTSNRFAAVPPVMPHDPFARTSDDEFVAEAAAQKLAIIGKQKEDIARLPSGSLRWSAAGCPRRSHR